MKRTRGVIRSPITRTLNALTDLLRGTDPYFTDLQVQLDFHLQKEAHLRELDNEIKDPVDDGYLENKVLGKLEYNMNISHTVARAGCALARNRIASNPSQVSDNGTALGDRYQVSARTGGRAHAPARKPHVPSRYRSYRYPPFRGTCGTGKAFWRSISKRRFTTKSCPTHREI
ncbi:hypothetical protein ISCGN_026393 [Ixodes scapularis]